MFATKFQVPNRGEPISMNQATSKTGAGEMFFVVLVCVHVCVFARANDISLVASLKVCYPVKVSKISIKYILLWLDQEAVHFQKPTLLANQEYGC